MQHSHAQDAQQDARGRNGAILPKSPADLMSMLSKPLPIRTIIRRALNFSRSSRVSVMV